MLSVSYFLSVFRDLLLKARTQPEFKLNDSFLHKPSSIMTNTIVVFLDITLKIFSDGVAMRFKMKKFLINRGLISLIKIS